MNDIRAKDINDKMQDDTNGIFEQYWRYCSVLRNWFVGFGAGFCLLLLTDKADFFLKMQNKTKKAILICLLVGVSVQIVLSFINKTIHWYIYRGCGDEEFKQTKRYKISESISMCFWIDFSADILTFFSFGYVIYKVFTSI